MNIIIDNKEAVLKKGSSFDFIAENRFFTGADSYSLSITFPLRGCQRNLDIFGHINRKDCNLDRLLLDCEIHDKDFHRYGSVSIVEISETEVKTQFLEGRSVRNYYSSMDEIYINELNLPSLMTEVHHSTSFYLRHYNKQKQDEAQGTAYLGFVCLPWVNNTSGNIQNGMRYVSSTNDFVYSGGGMGEYAEISGQPFLVEVIRQVLMNTRYDFDISAIENSDWSNVIVCNTLPLAWELYNMQYILPHWTISEFLEQVELFLNGEFIIDEKSGKMKFCFNQNTLENMKSIVIDKVIDSHKVEISSAEDVQNSYIEQKNLAYAECSHQMWKFYSCDWLKKQVACYTWNTFNDMKQNLNRYLDYVGKMTHAYFRRLHYCTALDTFFVLRCVRTAVINDVVHQYLRIQPINEFGKRIIDEREDAEVTQMGIVPVCIDHTDDTHGDMIFIDCGEYGADTEDDDSDKLQTPIVNILSAGEIDKREEYFDKLYVGFFDGYYNKYAPQLPRAEVDPVEVSPSNTLRTSHFSMRLSGPFAPDSRTPAHEVDHSMKFTFTFLADAVPDVRSIFLIHGKKYLAEKITATISENGLSQQMKMVAYRLI